MRLGVGVVAAGAAWLAAIAVGWIMWQGTERTASAGGSATPSAPPRGAGTCGPWSLCQALLRLDPTADPVIEATCADLPIQAAGTTFGQLQDAARRLGFGAELMRVDAATLIADGAPTVLWVDDGHFILAEPSADGRGLIIRDQFAPPMHSDDPAWTGRWHGEALRLRPRTVPPELPV